MTDENDQSIDHIIRLANSDVGAAISSKIGCSLTNDELQAIAAIIGNEFFWARAEELLMFVRHKTAGDVQNMVAALAERFREGTIPANDDAHERPARYDQCLLLYS